MTVCAKTFGSSLCAFAASAVLMATTAYAATDAPAKLKLQRGAAPASAHLANRLNSTAAALLGNKVMDPRIAAMNGTVQVMARLNSLPVARSNGSTTKAQLKAEQAAFIQRAQALAPSAHVIAQTQMAVNAVFLEVDAQQAVKLAKDSAVTRLVAVGNYRRDTMETVPYIGAKLVQEAGITGKGVRVAVLDSGIDYTHIDLGGPGTIKAYEAAWAPIPVPPAPPIPATGNYDKPNKYFPNKKVVGGFDFVGEQWPSGPLAPDANPIAAPDATTFGGHGTHVASIIGGAQGVAPGVSLYAVKVCSAPTSSCSGVALIQGLDFAVDPNGDGETDDRVDIVNMSLGSDYGQAFDDELSAAVDAAALAGVMTVSSAGNGSDKQFVAGTPAATDSALSVAQTEVPSSRLFLMKILSGTPQDVAAVFQPWSGPVTKTYQGAVLYPATNSDACAAFAPGALAGLIVLVDRGACAFSVKIANLEAGGAVLGIIGLITADAPFAGAYGGGGPITIPGFMISKADADSIRLGATVRFSPADTVSLAGSVVSSSSRGPRFDDGIIKPEIGAPGASISSASGSGTGTTAFGGTSGASPMVAGAAALLREAFPHASLLTLKQLLVNSADRNIGAPAEHGKLLPLPNAPITRIGGGQVRVDRAIAAPAIAYDAKAQNTRRGGLSFGYVDVPDQIKVIHKRVIVESTSRKDVSYRIKSTFRFADDAANGAVKMFISPKHLPLGAWDKAVIDVYLSIDGSKLRDNQMNAGDRGNAVGPLTTNEYDGYIVLKSKQGEISLPWQILPRKAARVIAPHTVEVDSKGNGALPLFNAGVGTANNDVYNLLAVGPPKTPGGRGQNSPRPAARAIGTHTLPVPAGLCSANQSFVWEFAFDDWQRKANPVGVGHQLYLDINRDGTPDFEVLNADGTLNDITDGRQRTWIIDLRPGPNQFTATSSFMAENATNTAVTVLRVCAEDVGLSFTDLLQGKLVDAKFTIADFYFGGGDDVLPATYTIAPLGEEYIPTQIADMPGLSSATLNVAKFPPYTGATGYLGLLLVTNGDRCSGGPGGNCGGATKRTEAILIPKDDLSWDHDDGDSDVNND